MELSDWLDTTPQPVDCPAPQSFNDYGYGLSPTRETRGRLWWTDGKVIAVDFTDWPNVGRERGVMPCA